MLDDDKRRLERAQRIDEAIRDSGVPQTAIAKACSVRDQAVSGWKRTGKIDKVNLKILARMTGYEYMYLLDGSGPKKLGASENQVDYQDTSPGEKILDSMTAQYRLGKLSDEDLIAVSDFANYRKSKSDRIA